MSFDVKDTKESIVFSPPDIFRVRIESSLRQCWHIEHYCRYTRLNSLFIRYLFIHFLNRFVLEFVIAFLSLSLVFTHLKIEEINKND